ncbi:hypothetical protein AAFF_G00214870 [Aldrovandia affinis]|uniref:Uncharacterized protein n=1 Tax=Aldrovandia affinis TaxID=143900 RepID=A0AAD7RGU0_9TELE|nr:hypothetical protein AAFF_G00214870 [Aldrovandia affinis]
MGGTCMLMKGDPFVLPAAAEACPMEEEEEEEEGETVELAARHVCACLSLGGQGVDTLHAHPPTPFPAELTTSGARGAAALLGLYLSPRTSESLGGAA